MEKNSTSITSAGVLALVLLTLSSATTSLLAQDCPSPVSFEIDWADYGQLNEDGVVDYPFTAIVPEIAGSSIDVTVTIPEAGSDDNRVGPSPGTTFPGITGMYTPTDNVYRYFKTNSDRIVTLVFDFSEEIAMGNFIYGGQRPPSAGTFAYSELTFWDGPNGTGNKVTSALADGGAVSLLSTTGDATTSSINVLQDQGMQTSFLSDDTYVGVGYEPGERPWTVLNMGDASIRSITWALYASNVDVSPSGTNTLDLATSRANTINSGNLSAYLSSFTLEACVVCPDDLVISAAATCDDGNGTAAAENTYYIEVADITGGAEGDYEVSIGGTTQTFTGDPLYFGPFDHSGDGGAVQTVSATEAEGPDGCTVSGAAEVPEVLCGVRPDGGQESGGFCITTTDPDEMTGVILAQSVPGTFIAGGTSGQIQAYVLVDAAGFIVQSNLTGLFTNLPSDTFQVFAVNYCEIEPIAEFLLPGESFDPVLNGLPDNDEASPLDGACYTVCNTDPVTMVPVNCLSIGSTVFTDNDDDATFEPIDGEMGIPSVDLTLFTESAPGVFDVMVASTTTDASGNYFFGGLAAGNYQISIPNTPTGYPASSTDAIAPTDATADDMDSGIQNGGSNTLVISPTIELMAGVEPTAAAEAGQGSDQDDNVSTATSTSNDDVNGDMTVDFGFVPGVSVGSTVFSDLDNDGTFEPQDGENGIEGVEIELYDLGDDDVKGGADDNLIGTEITDDLGNYLFDNLSEGSYYLKINTAEFGTGEPLEGAVSSDDVATTDSDNTTDNDDNGIEMGDIGDADFMVMSPVFVLEAGTEPGVNDEDGTGSMQDDDNELNGDMTKDFGFYPGLSIGSTVFVDDAAGSNATDNDGMQNNGEAGLADVVVQLFDVGADGIKGTADDTEVEAGADGLLGTADDAAAADYVTDAMGNYEFGNLAPGSYYVKLPTENFDLAGGAAADFPLSSTPTNESDDGMDGDDNGIQMGGVGGMIMSPIIELAAGDEPTDEPGQGGDLDGQLADGDLFDDNGDMTVDFGLIPAVSIGSTVFEDNTPGINATDNNGMQDPGEMGIVGVEVEIFDVGPDGIKGTGDDEQILTGPDGIPGTADDTAGPLVTGTDGLYFIAGLPEGTYYVKIQMDQFEDGEPLAGLPLSSEDIPGVSDMDNGMDSDDNGLQMGGAGGMVMSPAIELTAGDETHTEDGPGGDQDDVQENNGDMTVDFGFVPEVSVGSTVFSDLDNDGTFEPQDGENGIEGVEVELYDLGDDGVKGGGDDNLVGTEITDDLGNYLFDELVEGNYYLKINTAEFGTGEPLEGAVSSDDVATTDSDNTTDNDDNGIEMGDIGDADFMVMSPAFALEAGTEPGVNDEDGTGSMQDDDNELNGDMTKDFGFYPGLSIGSTVFVDDAAGSNATDNDGMQNNGEAGLADVVVQLFDVGADGIKGTADDTEVETGADGLLGTADDAAAADYVTDAMGNYEFGNLAPGSYYVKLPMENFDLAGGAAADFPLSSTPTNESDDGMDGDDNGIQMGGVGGMIMSPIIELAVGDEPTDEPGQGGDLDGQLADGDLFDDNGDMTVDFGLIPAVSIGSTVFEDNTPGINATDNNGMQDPGEMGIVGVEVEIFDVGPDGIKGTGDDEQIVTGPDGIPGTADDTAGPLVTGTDGLYFIAGLPEGTYYVKIQMDQFEDGEPLAGLPLSSEDIPGVSDMDNGMDSDDNGLQMGGAGGMVMSPAIELTAGDETHTEDGSGGDQDDVQENNGDMTVDFGFVPEVSVGSTVFLDEDNNGFQDDDEQGIAGVIVQLFDADDNFVAMTNTDSNGDYFFGGLNEGEYYITIPAADNFDDGDALAEVQLSSVPTDDMDNGDDEDDNGIQTGGEGTDVSSPIFALEAGTEPQNEVGQGGLQDLPADSNGDMTQDFGFVPINFDLALLKELAPGQGTSVEPGDTIYYQITVFNQGNLAADNITVTDYIPANMTFETGIGENANWLPASDVAGPSEVTFLLEDFDGADSLGIGASVTIDIALTINSPLLPQGTVLRNEAEISNASDEFGNPQEDIDSTPDNDDMNDNELVDNDVNGDANDGGDEDDHDWEEVVIEGFDLALLKVLADDQPALVRPGDTLHYRIRVINQGMIAADQIEVVDYLPADGTLIFEAGNNNTGWVPNADGNPVRMLSVANGGLTAALEPGDSAEVSIYLTLDNPLPAGATVENFAEIVSATDENGDPQADIDSTPDDDNDDVLNNDNDVSGDGNNGEDEDDHDIAVVEILRFDVALIKELATGQGSVVAPGDTVAYTLTVFNQGEIPADNIEISDYIPANMSFEAGAGDGVTDNMTIGWTETGGVATTTLTIDGGLLPGESTTVDIFLTLNNPLEAGIDVENFAEISDATDENGDEQEDDDSDLDDDPTDDDLTNDNETGGNGNIPGEDDDDHDVAVITTATFDLALIKELADGQSSSVEPGDTIAYVITIINQGEIEADNIEVTDYLPENMTFEGGITGNGDWTESGGLITRTIEVGDELTEPLAPNTSTQVTIYLTLDNPLPAGTVIDNFAEISDATDGTGDDQDDNDSEYDQDDTDDTLTEDNEIGGNGNNPGEDDDDHDIATVVVEAFDLALIKTLADGQSANVEAGDTVFFTMTIINQGMIAADNILISDYVNNIVDGFMWDPTIPVNADAGWMQVGPIGPDSLLVQTTLTVEDGDLPDGGLAPGSSVTVDIALVVNPAMEAVMELTNLSEISDATDENGDEVEDVDSPMDEDPFNDEFFEDNEVQGDSTIGEDEDNSDPASIFVGGFDLALQKGLAEGEPNIVATGDEITFTITVFNQGAIPADNIALVDYIPAGFLFDPELNPTWTDNGDGTASDTISVAEGTLPEGGLLPGQSTTVTITLTVAPPMFPDYALGEVGPDDVNPDGVESGQVLINEAEIVSATDSEGETHDDIDSTPDNMQDDNDDGTEVDDEINGGGDTNEDGINDEDEDDADIAIVTVECYQDPGVDNTITVCLGCDEATVVINLFESLAALPNIGGTFSEGDLIFIDDDGAPVSILDINGNALGSADFDPENVVIPGDVDRTRDYSIDYTIAAVNDCLEMVATITIDIFDIQNLSCTGFQNISLGEDCEAEITPDLVLQGNLICANSLEVVLLTLNGDTLRDANGMPTATVNNDQINETLLVSLVDPQCENTCWGQITIEDKKRPTIECPDNVDGFDGVDFICTDIDMILNQQNSLVYTGTPVIADNCTPEDELLLEFYDLLLPVADEQCSVRTILRTFTVTDESGNTATCVQQITVRPPTLDDVTVPTEEVVEISCGVDYDALPNGNPITALSGEPTITTAFGTYPIPGGLAYCTIAAGFEDSERIVTCPNTFKFVRTFRILDWCDPSGDPLVFTQVIKVGDFDAPIFTAPFQTDEDGNLITDQPLTFGTNAGDQCAAYLRLDDGSITLTDNCSAGITLTAEIFLNGDLDSAPVGAFTVTLGGSPDLTTAIPVGDHIIRYTYGDDCGNVDFTDVDIRIEDQTAPVAICEDGLNVSITGTNGDGFAAITPEMIDAGSYDDCSGVTLSIARVGDDDLPLAGEVYRNELILGCDDAGIVRVGLRVVDALGNENFCWLDILVEDKIAPACIAPGSVSITCSEYNEALPHDIMDASDETLDNLFGTAGGADNCTITITQSITGDVNSCGVGSFTRSFMVTDGLLTANCTQRITVIGVHDYRLAFPTDESGDCAEIPEYAGVEVDELSCDLITTTTNVDTLRTLDAGDECFKLRVVYDVVNWCEYNTLGDPLLVTRDGSGVNNRQRQPRDIDNDVLYVNIIANDAGGSDDDQAFMTLFDDRVFNPAAPQRDQEFAGYAASDSRGFFRYTQFIKIYDDDAPEISFVEMDECVAGSGEGCRATVELRFTATDDCSTPIVGLELDVNYLEANGFNPDNAAALGINISVDINEATGEYTVTATNVPVGEHALRVRADDGCGNTDVQIIEFCVTADRTPTPICIQTITVVLMDDGNGGGIAAIWASDFIASPVEDCFGNTIDKYSMFRSSDAGAAGFVPTFDPPATNGVTDITCDDIGDLSVRVYAFDDNGSTPDYCEVVVEVQDNMGHCEDASTGNIAGVILTESMEPVENVVVNLEGGDEQRSMTTTDDGRISFNTLELGADYTVTPTHRTDYLNGVRTSDIVAATRHILGVDPLASPYLRIAADANGDESIDVGDILTIRSLILGLSDEFPNNVGSWAFVSVDYEFPQQDNPWSEAFPEVTNYNDLQGNVPDADFVGVKIGDLNGSASPNLFAPGVPRNFRGDLELELDEVNMIQGETYTVPVTAAELTQVDGYQFTLEFDQTAVEIEGIEPGLVTAANFGWRFVNQGLITTSWSWSGTETPANWTGDEVLFSLVIRAQANGLLSEAIDAGNRFTEAEAYQRNGAGLRNLTFVFNEEIVELTGFRLLQNVPNPARKETVIGYELPEAYEEVTITITDAAGRLVRELKQKGSIGYNSITVTKRQLGGASGVYTYTVSAGEWIATKRMVVME